MVDVKSFWRVAALVAVLTGFGAAAFAGPASADDGTAWLCKPGQADNPCVGNVNGNSTLKGGAVEPLGYAPAADAKVDCFYVYPTQSNQRTANADLSPDKELKDVAVNQARQFSRVCNIYAPLYRQYTLREPVTDEVRDIAYSDVKNAWDDYLQNYNHGRGVIIIGHSQGSSHLSRLISDEIDPNADVRDKVLSAIIPGANVYVPKGKTVGGQFKNIPECESADQLGCVIAYSMFTHEPDPGASFGRVGSGYWINPHPQPDPAKYEVVCVNPGDLTDDGKLEPLADLGMFLTGNESGFLGQPDYYQGECQSSTDANWLNVSKIDPSDPRLDLAGVIDDGDGDLHLGDINLAEDNLVSIASTETDAFLARAKAREQLSAAGKKLTQLKRNRRTKRATVKRQQRKLNKAKKRCRKAKKAHKRVRARCKPVKNLRKRVTKNRRTVKKLNRKVTHQKRRITELGKIV